MLERERARISQDMHDDIGAGLTKIAMLSESPLQRTQPDEEVSTKMSKIASSSREMIARLNVIVWALNPRNDNLDSLFAYLKRYFGDYLENCGVRFFSVFPDDIPGGNISPDARRNIFYLVQEAVHNALKHGQCGLIELMIRINNQVMEITLHDDGKGFDVNGNASAGNGLINMRKRAEDLGGSIRIDSSAGNGTTVSLSLKMQQKGD
jgi:signal transduction histidine kinase